MTLSKGQPAFRRDGVPYQVAGSLRTAASRHLAGLDATADMDAPGRTIPTPHDATCGHVAQSLPVVQRGSFLPGDSRGIASQMPLC